MNSGFEWQPYTSVAQKKNEAVRHAAEIANSQKRLPAPINLQGRQIARTFWGKAWCDNLTSYQDYSSQLARGAAYLRNGSVVDLVIKSKRIDAIVAGSEPHEVCIKISELDKQRWKSIRSDCSASIDSLPDLLSGKLSDDVMKRLTDQKTGLFPAPREIRMSCSCPDYSSCCKHLAAVMYGIGARLDSQPELLFLLRGVNHQELAPPTNAAEDLSTGPAKTDSRPSSQEPRAVVGVERKTATAGAPDLKKKRGTGKAPVSTKKVKAVASKKTAAAVRTTKKAAVEKSAKKSGLAATDSLSKASGKNRKAAGKPVGKKSSR